MNFKLSFLFIFLLIVLSSFNPSVNEKIITWNENRPLSWDDFKGKPERRFAAASTSYDIVKEVKKINSETASVKIEAVFFCESSWKKKQWVNNSVLKHEQKHFDIVELFSRKLRKLILDNSYSSITNLESETDSLYKIIDIKMDVYQDLYDDETDGSMNGEKQREWETKITKEIKALDSYKETVLKISFK
ncbi:MAG: DUF922 domain-containing protein [Bacteroidota bacterium]|nr:DUF922 domain-containing protein [Bacteroidota bacterium]MDP3144117.1 DUF922 domain-containing protein [Bacteroidota bacterium]MDP3558160.1 DUF922 domain-containing protein [Bacteroidota bacterium]